LRLAVISDVHGNRYALEAVLDDISYRDCDRIVCLGDSVSGPLDPAGTADRLIALGCLTLSGNHDRWVLERDELELDPVDRFARARMKSVHRAWLASLHATAVLDGGIFLCHGTPRSDNEGWLDAWFYDRQTTLPDEDTVTKLAQGVSQHVMLCGHTHLARMVRFARWADHREPRRSRRADGARRAGCTLCHPRRAFRALERRASRRAL
jgi:predicted phosphodiesterase